MPRGRSHQPHLGRFESRANSITHPGPPRARDFRVRWLYRSQAAATLSILPITSGFLLNSTAQSPSLSLKHGALGKSSHDATYRRQCCPMSGSTSYWRNSDCSLKSRRRAFRPSSVGLTFEAVPTIIECSAHFQNSVVTLKR